MLHISDLNEAYISLHFVLLFPYSEAHWHLGIIVLGDDTLARVERVVMESIV